MLIHAAAHSDAFKAIVSEGASGQSVRDGLRQRTARCDAVLGGGPNTLATAIFTNTLPPPSLKSEVAKIAPTARLLRLRREGPERHRDEAEQAASTRPRASPKQIWEVPNGQHIAGITTEPAEYERRVVGFFDRTLLDRNGGPATWPAAAQARRAIVSSWGVAVSDASRSRSTCLDDNFLQPQPGTSAGDHLASGLVPLAILARAALVYPRLRPFAACVPRDDPGRDRDHVRRSRRLPPPARRRRGRRLHRAARDRRRRRPSRQRPGDALEGAPRAREPKTPLPAAALARRGRAASVVVFVVFPSAFSYIYTHTRADGPVTPDLGVPYETVDGHDERLARARRGLCPVEEPRRDRPLPGRAAPNEARMLIRHGYGVLLLDPRGQGRSEGDLSAGPATATLSPGAEYLQTPAGRRPRPHRRVRLLRRRRDPARGGCAVGRAEGGRLGGRRLPPRRGSRRGRQALGCRAAALEPGVLRHDRRHRPSSRTTDRRRTSSTGSAASRPEPGLPDLRRPGHGRRDGQAAEVLRGRRRAEGDLDGRRARTHGRHRRPAGRVRATRRRLLRPCATQRVRKAMTMVRQEVKAHSLE